MGDAGVQEPLPQTAAEVAQHLSSPSEAPLREIHVLVTGFGPFKFFTNNPSYLIASALPPTLSPAPPPPPTKDVQQTAPSRSTRSSLASILDRRQSPKNSSISEPLRPPQHGNYEIHIHAYPSPVRVSYAPTSVLIPSLLNPTTNASAFPEFPNGINFDYVFHIGLASGRESYTLETVAHRDDYVIPDVDEENASLISNIWQRENVPQKLDVGWNSLDVHWRWTNEVERREEETLTKLNATAGGEDTTSTNTAPPSDSTISQDLQGGFGMRAWMQQHGMLRRTTAGDTGGSNMQRAPKKAIVKLSRDAGRFLCEFIFMCSLIYRWKQAQLQLQEQEQKHEPTPTASIATAVQDQEPNTSASPSAADQLGKVAFLHVPNGSEPADVARGVMVAESAIRAIVASWEAGCRNPDVYPPLPSHGRGQGQIPETSAENPTNPASGDDVAGGVVEEKSTGDEIPALRNG